MGAPGQVLVSGSEAVPVCLRWVKPLPHVAPAAEDGWPRSTRSKRNVPTVPLGNREEMIHFQHHFTQDDLITLCEWTVPAMRTSAGPRSLRPERRVVWAITRSSAVCVLIIEYNRMMGGAQIYSRRPLRGFCSGALRLVWLKTVNNSSSFWNVWFYFIRLLIWSLCFCWDCLITKVHKYWAHAVYNLRRMHRKNSVRDTCACSGILIRTDSLFIFSGLIIYHFLCLHAQLAQTVWCGHHTLSHPTNA